MNFKALQEHGIASTGIAGKIHIDSTVYRPGLLTWPKFKDIPIKHTSPDLIVWFIQGNPHAYRALRSQQG